MLLLSIAARTSAVVTFRDLHRRRRQLCRAHRHLYEVMCRWYTILAALSLVTAAAVVIHVVQGAPIWFTSGWPGIVFILVGLSGAHEDIHCECTTKDKHGTF